MNTRKVLKWSVPVDDQDHPIGCGPVVLVACQNGPNVMQVWTDEDPDDVAIRSARVYGTGHPIPLHDRHIGSVVADTFVWHVFAAWRPSDEDPA